MAYGAYRVDIIESEAGWGQRIDDSVFFLDKTAAKEWADAYNKQFNPPGPAPDWYMYACDPSNLVEVSEAQHKALKKKHLWKNELIKVK